MLQILLVIVLAITLCRSFDEDGQAVYRNLDLFVFSSSGKETVFRIQDSSDKIKALGLNKDKKYRWLVHDCMATRAQMRELAKIFKTNYPDDNVILVEWIKMRSEDPDPSNFSYFRYQLEWLANGIIFAIHTIHARLYDSQSPSVRENSHLIGFGHGGVIVGHAGWLANHKNEMRVQWKYENEYPITDFAISRITVINPIQFCQLESDQGYKVCEQAEKYRPGYNKQLVTQESATFLDCYYTTNRGYSYSVYPLAYVDPIKGLAHHRGVIFIDNTGNHELVGGCKDNPGQFVIKLCSEAKGHCVHQKALKFYMDAMRLLNSTKGASCNDVVAAMFGETDPNRPGETLSANFHIQSEKADVLTTDYDCETAAAPRLPDNLDGTIKRCEHHNLEVVADTTWNLY